MESDDDFIAKSQAARRMRAGSLYPSFHFRVLLKAMRSVKSRYRGFRLIAFAQSSNADGLCTASVSIVKHGQPVRHFSELDLFYDDIDALEYATTWGRVWIEANVHFPAPSKAARECE